MTDDMTRSENPVATYCAAWEAYRAIDMSAEEFARHMITRRKGLCLQVLEVIGCWPSSEAELRALQRAWRG